MWAERDAGLADGWLKVVAGHLFQLMKKFSAEAKKQRRSFTDSLARRAADSE